MRVAGNELTVMQMGRVGGVHGVGGGMWGIGYNGERGKGWYWVCEIGMAEISMEKVEGTKK